MGVSEAVEGEDEVLLEDWPLRPWLLAAIGAVAGIAVWALVDGGENVPWRLGIASFAFFAAAAAGFALRRRGWLETAVFSLGLGVVMGGIAYMAARASDTRAGQDFAFAAGVFFSVLAIPLFQAGFHRTRFATPYRETHFHVWTDAVSAGGAFAFALLSWALVWLLHGLFSLIGIKAIGDLLGEGWFSAAYLGASFGAGLGVIRNNLRILGALQGVVLLVLSLLALPFAAAILVFLVLLLASGGQALWNATSDSTPVLLACAVGCFILANSVIRDGDDARSGNRLMQGAAAVLAACILPLSLFAAIGMGIRIGQYGLAPERIWALVAIAVAVAYGVAYWAGLLRGQMAGWSEHLRRANLHLAAVVCVLALLLSLPIVDFGAISASNQLARLKRGSVSAEEFDYTALRWDFGNAGRRALARLAQGQGEVAELAVSAQEQTARPYGASRAVRADCDYDLEVRPDTPELRREVLAWLKANPYRCEDRCVVIETGVGDKGRGFVLVDGGNVQQLRLGPDGTLAEVYGEARDVPQLKPGSTVEIRSIEKPYVFIDGEPLGGPLDAFDTSPGVGNQKYVTPSE